MLAQLKPDRLPPVWSNAVAVAMGAIASNVRVVWWLDPAGAIFISVAIILRWFGVIKEQCQKLARVAACPSAFAPHRARLVSAHMRRIVVHHKQTRLQHGVFCTPRHEVVQYFPRRFHAFSHCNGGPGSHRLDSRRRPSSSKSWNSWPRTTSTAKQSTSGRGTLRNRHRCAVCPALRHGSST